MKFPTLASLPSADKSNLMVTSLAAITEQAEVQNTAASLCTQTQFLIWQYIRNKPKSQKQPLNLATMQEKEIKEKKPSTK